MQFKESEENSEMAKTSKQSQMDSIKKKLMAATAMLLVAAIMTVSSTYAWFTLSTAPEVSFIYVETENGGILVNLKDKPEAEICVCCSKPVAVYEYCNLHGLWKTEL